MKELKIEVPQGYEIDKDNSTFENIVFKEKTEFPKWEELRKIDGYYISTQSEITKSFFDPDNYNINVFATREQARASIALAQLSQLMKYVNGDWKPDWKDGNPKYSIRIFGANIEIKKGYYIQHFLTFPTREKAEGFLEAYRDLIEQAKPLL